MRTFVAARSGWAVLLWFGSVAGWVACSSSDRSFDDMAPSAGGDGGTAGETPSSAGSSGETFGEGGSNGGVATGDAGSSSSGAAPIGGEGGVANSPACGSVYNDWFRATFPYPDGGILGVADFPSSPWRLISGTLTTLDGAARSTGNSLAAANQGLAFDSVATRARFKLSFAKAEQTAAMRMNAERDGTGGLAIRVAADTGEVTVSIDDQAIATEAFGALDAGTSYFVQATLSEGSLAVTLSTGNYAGVPGGNPLGTLVVDQLDSAPTGTHVAIELNGTGTSIDDLGLAACGTSPPKYKALLRDTFTRPQSASPGKPEIPATSTWTSSLGTGAKVNIGANELLLSQGASIYTEQGQHYGGSGLRFRSSAKFASLGWFVLHFNAKADGGAPVGFDLWRETDTNIFIEYGGAAGSGRYPFALDVDTYYFLQFDVDGDVAVATMRSGSYEGPIMFGSYVSGLVDSPVAQTRFSIGNTWSSDLAITEVFVDQYAP